MLSRGAAPSHSRRADRVQARPHVGILGVGDDEVGAPIGAGADPRELVVEPGHIGPSAGLKSGARLIARAGASAPRGARSKAGANAFDPLACAALRSGRPPAVPSLKFEVKFNGRSSLASSSSAPRGVLGRAVAAELAPTRHRRPPGRRSGDIRIDIADPASIEAGLTAAGPLDAVACAAGAVNFRPLSAIEPAPLEQSSYGLGLDRQAHGPGQSGAGGARPLSTTAARSP